MYKYIYWYKFKEPKENYKPVILITGCSSGIGLATSKLLFAKQQFRLVLTTREKSLGILKTEFPESPDILILPLDVADEKSRRHLVQKIFEKWDHVDVLINNAGICYRSVLEEMLDSDEYIQMNTNYLGPVSLIRMLLPKMRKNGQGKIINVSSVSGMLAMPTMASYSASKFALEGAMEALWYETRPFGIDVSLVQPGFVRSKSHERVKFSIRSMISNKEERPYSDVYYSMIPFVTKLMNIGIATPESIANLIYYVIKSERPPLWVPASFDAEFFYYLKRWLPRRIILPFFYWTLPNSQNWGKNFSHKKEKNWFIREFNNTMLTLQQHWETIINTLFKKQSEDLDEHLKQKPQVETNFKNIKFNQPGYDDQNTVNIKEEKKEIA